MKKLIELFDVSEASSYPPEIEKALDALQSVSSNFVGDTEDSRDLVMALIDQMDVKLPVQHQIKSLLGTMKGD